MKRVESNTDSESLFLDRKFLSGYVENLDSCYDAPKLDKIRGEVGEAVRKKKLEEIAERAEKSGDYETFELMASICARIDLGSLGRFDYKYLSEGIYRRRERRINGSKYDWFYILTDIYFFDAEIESEVAGFFRNAEKFKF